MSGEDDSHASCGEAALDFVAAEFETVDGFIARGEDDGFVVGGELEGRGIVEIEMKAVRSGGGVPHDDGGRGRGGEGSLVERMCRVCALVLPCMGVQQFVQLVEEPTHGGDLQRSTNAWGAVKGLPERTS